MSFWTDAKRNDPKRAYKWRVSLGDPNFANNYIFYAKECSKPRVSNSEITHSFMGYKFYYPGVVTWEPVTMKVVDTTEPDAMLAMAKLFEAGGYKVPENPNSVTTPSKSASVAALGHVTIEQFDEKDLLLEVWVLRNAFLKDVQPDGLSYESEQLSTYDMVFRYDWAEFMGKNGERAFYA